MRVVLAPDKFKSCLSAAEVATAMAEGIRQVDPSTEIDFCPMADGGEGTVDALVQATGGRFVSRRVTGPLPEMSVDAKFGFLRDGETAVVEMAAASGLHLLRPEQYDPLRATTYGTGELLVAAVELGAKKIILGIGGSATVDGGIGCAQAASSLRDLHIAIVVACDVTNPLYGPEGAARVFGPQKGATPEQVDELDARLRKLAEDLDAHELAHRPGAGAAGGFGFGMMAYFGATLRPGIDIIVEATKLHERLRGADLCLTGEGRLDAQTLTGKTVVGVAGVCSEIGVPCVALCGSVDPDVERAYAQGLTAYFSIAPGPITLEQAIARARESVVLTTRNLVRVVRHHRRG